MNSPRMIFFGTSEFACAILQVLIDEKYNVIAAVSQPDRPVGRKHRIEKTPVHELADRYGIPVLQPEKLSREAECVLELKPQIIVTCAYGQFVPDSILEAPELGCVNIHPSLLPKYRGGAPMHYAVLNGDAQTGVCLMEMTHEMDAGKIYAKTVVDIGEDMTMAELSVKLKEASTELVRENLPAYIRGELPGVPQDSEGVVIARNISREQEQIRFAEEEIGSLYNHVRALIDWPVSYGLIEGKRIKFLQARKTVAEHEYRPGTVIGFRDHAMEIACIGGILRVLELQPEGKSRMSADAFANGAGRTLTGKVFE